ncbi:toxin-antitoxin system, antitoxin component, PHD domain protein [Leptospira santarosai str. 200702252]|nr:toxin-antitoxin system, antitoxin component, PHD domain protein [Leptospira santarosai str. 200702252]
MYSENGRSQSPQREFQPYLRLVKEGETILVMERNQVVAEIKKPSIESDGTIENFLQKEEKKASF